MYCIYIQHLVYTGVPERCAELLVGRGSSPNAARCARYDAQAQATMRFGVSLLVLLLNGCTVATSDQLPGVRGWVSDRLLQFSEKAIIPLVVAKISQASIPDISGEKDSVEYSFTNFKVGGISLSPHFSFVAGGVHLGLDGITSNINCDWHYKEKHWPHVPYGGGTAKIDIDAGTKVDVTLIPSVGPDGTPVLALSGLAVALDLGHISIHGSMLSWLYDVLIDLVKGSLEKAVDAALGAAVTAFVRDDVAKILASLNLVMPLQLHAPFDIAEIDFSLKRFNVTSSHMTVDAKGEIESRNASDPPFPDAPPYLPDAPPSAFENYMLSISIKDWVLNSGLWLFWTKNLLYYTLLPSDVPRSFPVQLTTASFASIAPQLPHLYPNMTMALTVNASGQPLVEFDAHGHNAMTASIPSHLSFAVLLPNGSFVPAFTLSVPVGVGVHAWVGQTTAVTHSAAARAAGSRAHLAGSGVHLATGPEMVYGNGSEVIYGNVSLLECTPLSVISSQVGTVRVSALSSFVAFLLAHVVVPAANKLVEAGFPIPTSSAGVGLDRVALEIQNDALQVRADFTYTAPP